jgi:hypothetical protein
VSQPEARFKDGDRVRHCVLGPSKVISDPFWDEDGRYYNERCYIYVIQTDFGSKWKAQEYTLERESTED